MNLAGILSINEKYPSIALFPISNTHSFAPSSQPFIASQFDTKMPSIIPIAPVTIKGILPNTTPSPAIVIPIPNIIFPKFSQVGSFKYASNDCIAITIPVTINPIPNACIPLSPSFKAITPAITPNNPAVIIGKISFNTNSH